MVEKDFISRSLAFFTPQRRRYLRQLIGLGLIVLLAWQLSHGDQLVQWWQDLQRSLANGNAFAYLLPAVLLMPINWTLETLKWRQLLGSSSGMSWRETWASVLAGISVSLATPNRIGEYGGRAMVAPVGQAVNIVWTSIIGSLCQWTAFIVCGWPSLCLWLQSWYNWSGASTWLLAISLPAILVVVWLVLFRVDLRSWLNLKLHNYKWWRWVQLQSKGLATISTTAAVRALLLAIVRFVVYCFQFLLLLWFYGASLSLIDGISGIFSIYLIQAGIPLPPGLSVISRSEIAVLFWDGIAVNPLTIVSATFSVYLLNLVVPAMLGAWVILRKNKHNN